jgi:NitT/TauT family transport system substrate-binding protein
MRLLGGIIFSCMCVFLLACSQQTPTTPVRIGINAWPGYEFISLAEQLGYFQEEGLAVKLIPFQTLADGSRAFEKHQIDIIGGTLMELYGMRDVPGVEPRAFLIADFSNGSDMLLAHKKFASVAALKGKKIGLEAGTVDVLTAANALASAQLTFADVTLVPLPQPSVIKALLAGDVDAAQTYTPFATEALANPDIIRLFDTSQTPGVIVDVLLTSGRFLQERPEDLGKIARAFFRAQSYYQNQPEDAIARMAKREGISADDFKAGMAGLQLVAAPQQLDYLGTHGKLMHLLGTTHQALTAIKAVKGPACAGECFTAQAFAQPKATQ